MNRYCSMLAFIAVLSLGAAAQAVNFIPPWTRGGANATYQQWDTFSSAVNPNAPDVADVNPNGSASLTEISPYDPMVEIAPGTFFPNKFVTSAGNIYSFLIPTAFEADVPMDHRGAGSFTTVLLQTRTQGVEPDLASFTLKYNDGTDHTLTPFGDVLLGQIIIDPNPPVGGVQPDYGFIFHVPYSPGNLLLNFSATDPSMSLDIVVIDTITTSAPEGYARIDLPNAGPGDGASVPEPATGALLLPAGVVVARRRRSRPRGGA